MKEWIPDLLEIIKTCPLSSPNHCPFLEKGQHGCTDCPLIKLAQRKLLKHLIANTVRIITSDGYANVIDPHYLVAMLKQLEAK
jgi:hypothetical protein